MPEFDAWGELISKNPGLQDLETSFTAAIDRIGNSIERGNKLIIAGNGGSMSDALHISGELLKAYRISRAGYQDFPDQLEPGIPVWVLGINPILASAVENDLPERASVFAQELGAVGRPGDVFLGISTSGRSANLLKTFELAGKREIVTISLTGRPGEPLSGMADVSLRAPGADTAEIQEQHIQIYHCLCGVLEERFFGSQGSLTGLYGSRYSSFDRGRLRLIPLEGRENKTSLEALLEPSRIGARRAENSLIADLAGKVYEERQRGKPVVLMMGAHPIKNGLSPLIIDLMQRSLITHIAGNGACPIHDVELALCGGTSERVPETLPDGNFGFARETGIVVNGAYREARKRRMGAGEALGGILNGDIPFPELEEFPYREYSLYCQAYRLGVPATIHGTIGTDITDQHPNADFEAKGYACGIDFSLIARTMSDFGSGGVVLNLSSAVTQPEVLLKSVSMAANAGTPPAGIVTAVFDLADLEPVSDESEAGYYRRDIKSVVTRIPEAFGGSGSLIQGDHRQTFPAFYAHLLSLVEENL